MSAPAFGLGAVSVNGVTIAAEVIANEAQNHPMPKNKPGWAWRAAAQALVLRELLLQEAARQGLVADPIELQPGKWETNEEALVRQLLDEVIEPAPADDDALRALYEADPGRYRSPSLYEAAHILFPVVAGDEEGRAKAKLQAEIVLADLKRDPKQFGALASRYSACPSGAEGGMLGQLAAGDTVPEFEAVLASLDEGAISDAPVETRYGLHIIRLIARERGRVLPFEAVRPHLREAQEKAAWLRASRAYAENLVAGATIDGIDLGSRPWLDAQKAA